MKLLTGLGFLLCWSFCVSLSAQSLRSIQNININSIVVRQPGLLTKAHILLDNPEIKVRNNRRYFYYTKGSIQNVQGGFHGHLLHGEFSNFVEDERLQTQGWFKKGLKHGLWKEWNAGGDLVKEITWHKGKVHGPFTQFLDTKTVKGKNKNGQLHGNIKTYVNGQATTVDRYRQGELKSTKDAPPPLLKRIRFQKQSGNKPPQKKEKKKKKPKQEKESTDS